MKKNCPTCKKDFFKKKELAPSQFKKWKFCSRICYYESIKGKVPVSAWVKGTRASPKTEFKKGSKGHLGFKHTDESKHKMSLAQVGRVGENSANWRGGFYPLNMLIRRSKKYRDWRLEVFKRDKFTCVMCGSIKSGNFEADHIEAFSVIMRKHGVDSMQNALICADLWSIKNGRTLCVPCHKKTDNYGVKALFKKASLMNK